MTKHHDQGNIESVYLIWGVHSSRGLKSVTFVTLAWHWSNSWKLSCWNNNHKTDRSVKDMGFWNVKAYHRKWHLLNHLKQFYYPQNKHSNLGLWRPVSFMQLHTSRLQLWLSLQSRLLMLILVEINYQRNDYIYYLRSGLIALTQNCYVVLL